MAVKKSTRKITLEVTDKLTVFFKNNETNKVFTELENKFNVSIKINAIGMLVLRGEKDVTARLEKCFNQLKTLKRSIEIQDIYDILDGKLVIEEDLRENWTEFSFRDKSGRVSTIKPKSPHQQELVEEILNKKVIFAGGSAGVGKAQPLDAKILTPTGWTTMGNIKVGDKVISSSGLPTLVLGVFPQGEKDIYKITFSDGSSTECCKEHLWLTKNEKERQRKNNNGSVKSLEEIIASVKCHDGRKNHSIPLVGEIEFKEQDIPIDPYVLGILIGDGCLRGFVGFSSIDCDVVNYIKEYSENIGLKLTQSKHNTCDYRIAKSSGRFETNGSQENKLYNKIKKLELNDKKSQDKFVPDIYKFNSIEIRTQILRGLMDSDGTCGKNGSYSFFTASQKLSEDVKFLVLSLGGVAHITQKSRGYKDSFGSFKQCLDSYTVFMNLPNHINPFNLKRKSNRVTKKTKYVPNRYVESVEFVGKKEAQCIMVEDKNHLYVTDDFILTHNTFIAVAVALRFLEQRLIRKIVVTRPAIAAEEFGFLPGDIDAKMSPFLYPIFSIFEELVGKEKRDEYIQKGYIEILPVAFSRGVTLGGKDGVITIIDEAENLTIKQAYLMLTRLGNHINSKIIFAGDEFQTDLKKNGNSLSTLKKILGESPYCGFVEFDSSDVVRSEIVKDIVKRFEEYEVKMAKESNETDKNTKKKKE